MGHYYDKGGSPCHYQPIKTGKNKGNLRGTTVADARKLDLVPSVTTILDVLSKGEGLTNWKIEQALSKFKMEQSGEEFIQRDYAEEGTQIHAVIEGYILNGKKNNPTPEDFLVVANPEADPKDYIRCYEAMRDSLGLTAPVAEKSFATDVYGGSVDIHDSDQNFVIDLKTKDGILDDKRMKTLCTDEYGMQLVAYREGLKMGGATCVSWFVSRTHPHSHNWVVWDEERLEKCEEMFELATKLWYLKKRFTK